MQDIDTAKGMMVLKPGLDECCFLLMYCSFVIDVNVLYQTSGSPAAYKVFKVGVHLQKRPEDLMRRV